MVQENKEREKPESATLEFLKSKSSKMTALLNGIYLHSPSNPILEAQRFIDSKRPLLQKKKTFLVLGLGLAYHVQELSEQLKNLNKDESPIYIVEPQAELCNRFLQSLSGKNPHIQILCQTQVKNIYATKHFIQFLKTSPGIIIHPGSYAAQKDFFQEFLKYRNSTQLESIIPEINEESFKNLFQGFDKTKEIQEVIEVIKNKSVWNQWETLLLAYTCIK